MRLFVAIIIPLFIREKLIAVQQRLSEEKLTIRFVDPDNFHSTLLFLGEVNFADVPEIIRVFKTIRQESFLVCLDSLEYISKDEQGIIWCSLKSTGLKQLAESIRVSLAQKFIVKSEPFIPHITVARLKKSLNNSLVFKYLNSLQLKDCFEVNDFVLMESKSFGNIVRYYLKHRFSLMI